MCTFVLLASCRADDVRVEYIPGDAHEFSPFERRAIEDVANRTAIEVRRALPQLPRRITIRVQSGTDVIPETGETASATPPGTVRWTVDAGRSEGVHNIVETQLRPTLIHEFHHLVRGSAIETTTLMDAVISEGMATAFERDLGGVDVPWGRYPPEVADWVEQLLALPDDANRSEWLFRHPDGRRWIGLRAGTYLVDRAMKATGRSAADLVVMPTDEVVRLALDRAGADQH